MNIIINKSIISNFPQLMIHRCDLNRTDPIIILFTSEDTGTVLSINTGLKSLTVGRYENKISISEYVPYTGSVTLSN